MFLDAIVIVAREVIESAMVACLLVALVRICALPTRAVFYGFAVGVVLAALYGSTIDIITPWWDYRGQEIVMVGVNTMMVGLILVLLAAASNNISNRFARHIPIVITLLLSLSLTLEISEIGIYIGAYRNKPDLLGPAIVGSTIGVGIGVSLAVLVFYALTRLRTSTSVCVILVFLALLAGGLLSQSVQLLSQVDSLPAQTTAWDSSSILAENTILGQLLVAVLRYEARPTWLQVFAYTGGIALAVRLGIKAKVPAKMRSDNPL